VHRLGILAMRWLLLFLQLGRFHTQCAVLSQEDLYGKEVVVADREMVESVGAARPAMQLSGNLTDLPRHSRALLRAAQLLHRHLASISCMVVSITSCMAGLCMCTT
jgi:hypothetical protein